MLKVEIIGRLGFDAQLKEAAGFDKKHVSMSVAHSEYSRDETGERVEKTTWVNVTWYSEGGNLLQHLKKGAQVFIRGRLRVNVYQDRTGNWVAGINLTASEVEIVTFVKQEEVTQAPTQNREVQIFPNRKEFEQEESKQWHTDDLPF